LEITAYNNIHIDSTAHDHVYFTRLVFCLDIDFAVTRTPNTICTRPDIVFLCGS
jgi:hypothetical protein